MKRLLLAGVLMLAALHVARAETETKWPSPNFVIDCRRDRLFVYFDKEDYTGDGVLQGGKDGEDPNRVGIIIQPFDKAARMRLEKELREWRKCDAYYQCLADRDAGKVKHCYANDKRWRSVYSGEL
jgi:hypothetical protein